MSNLLSVEVEKIQHENFMREIKGIPPIKRSELKTFDQREFHSSLQGKYFYIGRHIDYRQQVKFGFDPPAPLDGHWGEHESIRLLYRNLGEWYFWQLQLIAEGWKFIVAKVKDEQIGFPFTHARMMFAAIMREHAEIELQPALKSSINNGITLKAVRDDWRNEARLLRDRAEAKETAQFIYSLKMSGWRGYWLYAIWEHRFSNAEIQFAWTQYLKAHKAIAADVRKRGEASDGCRNLTIRWNAGRAIFSDSGKTVQWDTFNPTLNSS